MKTIIVALLILLSPANTIVKQQTEGQWLKDLSNQISSKMKKCEAKEETEYCAVEITIVRYTKNNKKKADSLFVKSGAI